MRETFLSLFAFLLSVAAQGQTGEHVPGAAPDMLYLSLSKGVYETGEDLWFKALQLDRLHLSLSDSSRTLFLEVRTVSDSVVWSEKYPLSYGRGDGHVLVSEDWSPGEYLMYGFSRSTLTGDSTQSLHPRKFFVAGRVHQMDSVLRSRHLSDSLSLSSGDFRFGLYPEGGHLIAGIPCRVAFKSSDSRGYPREVAGTVTDNGREVLRFSSEHAGMGSFMMVPEPGHAYKATLSDGREYPFPAVRDSGLTFQILKSDTAYMTIKVFSSDKTSDTPFSLFAQIRGIPCCSARGVVRGERIVRLPLREFPCEGIAELTLYDGEDHPVSERLVYVHPDRVLHITASMDRDSYFCRTEGKLRLKVTDDAGRPVRSELSVSIHDAAYSYPPGEESILSHCLLSGQVRGNIYNPSYYFDDSEDRRRRQRSLDLLLLTQGWRKYDLQDTAVVRPDSPAAYVPILQDGVSGRQVLMTRRQHRQSAVGGEQLVRAFTPLGDSVVLWTDAAGRFEIDPVLMTRLRGNIYLKPLLTDAYRPRLELVDPFVLIDSVTGRMERYTVLNGYDDGLSGSDSPLVSDSGVIALDEVVVHGRRRDVYRDKVLGYLDSLAIIGTGAYVCEHNGGRPTIYLNDYEEGYTHDTPEDPPVKKHLPVRGERYEMVKYEPCTKRNCLYYVADIKYIVYQGPRYTEAELLRMNNMWKAQGYYPRREFYEADRADMLSPVPDPRNTLMWKPSVLTDEHGEAEISFVTSDLNVPFRCIIEGTDGLGLLGATSLRFNVLKDVSKVVDNMK